MTTKYLDGAGLKYFHDTYVLTSSQITTMINNALSQYKQDIVTVVSALPTTGQKEGILYMVPDATDATKFDTFVWEITDDTTTPPTDGWVENDIMPYNDGNAWIRDPNLNVIWVRKTISVDASTRLFLTFAADNGCVVWVDNVLVGSSNRDNLDVGSNDNNPVELEYLLGEKGFVNILIKAFTESTATTQMGNYLNVDIDRVEAGTPYDLTVEYKND